MSLGTAGWLLACLAAGACAVALRRSELRLRAVARACHELRGPLTAAQLGVQFAQGRGALTPERLRAIDLELGRAGVALGDLSELHRVSWVRRPPWPGVAAGLGSPDFLDLEEVVCGTVRAYGPVALARGVRLEFEWRADAARVFGNRFRIAQALGNVLANGIEHGGEAVTVRGRRVRDSVRVEVLDAGPGLGVPVAELVRRGRRSRGPHGHGLAVAAAVVAAHGGRLCAAPSERGARIVLEFPAARRPEQISGGS